MMKDTILAIQRAIKAKETGETTIKAIAAALGINENQ